MDKDSILRMNEINALIQDGLLPFERMRLLLEEMLELKINYDLKGYPVRICSDCLKLKHACFFEKDGIDNYYKVCRYCRLVKAENLRKQISTYYCPTCDIDLKISNVGQTNFLIKKHKNTKKHLRIIKNL